MEHSLRCPTGDRLHLTFRSGRRSTTGVLVIHGRGDTADGHVPRLLRRTAQELGLPVVAVDLPGHGRSSGTFADFVYSKAVRDLEHVVRWMRKRGMVRVAAVGHSLGAALAISLAAASKVVGDVVALAPPVHLRKTFLARYSPLQLAQLPHRGFAEYVRMNGSVERQHEAFFNDLEHVDLLRDAEKVRVPTLIVHGTADFHHTIADERALAAAIGGERKALRLLSGCGHDFLSPHAQRVQRLVAQHLRRYFVPSISPIVNVVVRRADGRLLFVKRSPQLFFYGGRWHVVAGFLDAGKTPAQQAKVELREELGVSPTRVRIVHVGAPIRRDDPAHARRWRINPVLVQIVGRWQPKLNWENVAARWLTIAQLQDRPRVPGIMDSLAALGLV